MSPTKRLDFNWKLYEDYIENPDLTDEEKEQAIEAMWNIVTSFVDFGFGAHPIQQINLKTDIEDHNIQDLLEPYSDNLTK